MLVRVTRRRLAPKPVPVHEFPHRKGPPNAPATPRLDSCLQEAGVVVTCASAGAPPIEPAPVHTLGTCGGSRGRGDAPGRKARREAAAPPDFALDVQVSLMPCECVLDDREAEAGATGIARTSAIDTVKTLGQPRDVLCRDPGPRIFDGERRAIAQFTPRDADLAAGGRVAHCIAHEIAECAGELVFGAQYGTRPRGDVEDNRVAPRGQCFRVRA